MSLPTDIRRYFSPNGRRLILMDVHAHIILDFIDNAIPA